MEFCPREKGSGELLGQVEKSHKCHFSGLNWAGGCERQLNAGKPYLSWETLGHVCGQKPLGGELLGHRHCPSLPDQCGWDSSSREAPGPWPEPVQRGQSLPWGEVFNF